MYQASHPGVSLTPRPRSPTLALGGAGPDDLSTLLYPFRHPNRARWTSNDVVNAESIFAYGYSYPEVPQGLSTQDLQSFATEKVNELYAPQSESSPPAQARLFLGNDSGIPDVPTARLEWTANVQALSTELTGSHRIRFFIGAELSNDNLAGVAAIFANPSTPLSTPNDQINASVPLTSTLVEKNVGLDPSQAVPVLKEQLSWVVERRTNDGTGFIAIKTTDLSSLIVSVVSNEANYPIDKSQLPTKGEPVTYYEPTEGKAGGLQRGKQPKIGVQTAGIDDNNNGTSSRVMKARRL